jgi:hypothetical protein
MSNDMKIDVCSIESKLFVPSLVIQNKEFINAIEYFIEEIIKYESSGEVRNSSQSEDNAAVKAIKSYANMLSEKINDQDALQVLDSLRHAFTSYAFNGLHQLYTRQENECWYPKIILNEVLTPNDIDSLPEIIQLYRGCSVNEYESGDYGQAWTTSIDRAKDFAYNHYQGQDWFNIKDRIVLDTKYSRDNVLFSDQSIEFEVVVDVSKLGKVNKYT